MKFFLGSMKDGVDHEQLYEKLKKRLAQDGYIANDERIYMICHNHKGNIIKEKVNEDSPTSRDTVIAIFHTQVGYIVVTPSRGYLTDLPLFVGTVLDIRYFDE